MSIATGKPIMFSLPSGNKTLNPDLPSDQGNVPSQIPKTPKRNMFKMPNLFGVKSKFTSKQEAFDYYRKMKQTLSHGYVSMKTRLSNEIDTQYQKLTKLGKKVKDMREK